MNPGFPNASLSFSYEYYFIFTLHFICLLSRNGRLGNNPTKRIIRDILNGTNIKHDVVHMEGTFVTSFIIVNPSITQLLPVFIIIIYNSYQLDALFIISRHYLLKMLNYAVGSLQNAIIST